MCAVVRAWSFPLDPPASELTRLEELLSPEERKRADRFAFPELRRRFVAARGRLRRILAECLGVPPEELVLAAGPHGKPRLTAPETDLHFNLSHSHERGLLALAWGREVGVDLEWLGRDAPGPALARRYFSPAEAEALQAVPEGSRAEAFFRLWTRKEAYLKGRGTGIGGSLSSFTASLDDPPRLLAPEEATRWRLEEVRPAPDYLGAVAAPGHDWRLVLLSP